MSQRGSKNIIKNNAHVLPQKSKILTHKRRTSIPPRPPSISFSKLNYCKPGLPMTIIYESPKDYKFEGKINIKY